MKLICDICNKETAVYDGLTIQGPWAYMCKKCWRMYGVRKKGLYFTLKELEKGSSKDES